jgi:cytoskeletal protein CcmA (bactofilin family)
MAIRTFNSVGGFSVGENPTTVVLANGDITTGNGNVQANTAVKTDSLLHLDGSPWDFQQPAGSANGQVQYYLNGDFGASANFSFDPTTNRLTVTGNTTVTGNVTSANFIGNLIGNISGNITAPGQNTYVQFNDSGYSNAVGGLTFNKSSNTLTVNGNITTNNANLGNLVTANYTTAVLTTGAQPNITSVGTLSSLSIDALGNVSGANYVTANYFTGTLTTGAQPNITSTGTLTSLTVTGNISSGNANLGNLGYANYLGGILTTASQPNITTVGTLTSLSVTGNANVLGNVNAANLGVSGRVITSLIPSGDSTLDVGATGNKWKDVYLTNIYIGTTYIKSTGNVITTDAANVANNLSVGTFTSRGDATLQANLTVAGDLTVGGNTTYINVTTLSIKDPLISLGGGSNGANASSYDGKDRGLVLDNYYSNGSGPVNQAFIWKTGSGEFQAISEIDNITNEVVTASAYANIRAQTFLGNVTGNIITAIQSNITTVGTLSDLVIAGNLQVNTNANLNSLKASGLQYPTSDGTASQVISTYGNGQLYFATISTSSLSNGNSNIIVYTSSNVAISSRGVANVLTVANTGVYVSGVANISDTLNVSNTATVGNLNVKSYYPNGTASSNVSTLNSATVTTSGITANQAIATFPYAGIRGAEFIVKGEESSGGKYSVATVLCVHDSTGNVDYSVYGTVLLGGATGTLAVNVSGSNLVLGVTPTSSNTTVWTAQYRTI